MIKCEICSKEFANNKSGCLTVHLQNEHSISLADYVVSTEYNGVEPKCICGLCDERPVFYRGKFLKYAIFHNRYDVYREKYIEKFGIPKCEICGKDTGFKRLEPRKYCSQKCAMTNKGFCNPAVQEKIKESVKEKYGVDYISQLDSVKQKLRELALLRPGTPCTEENKKLFGKLSKERWKNKNYKKRTSESIRSAIRNNPNEIKRRSDWIKNRIFNDPTFSPNILLSKLHLRIRNELDLDSLGFSSEKQIGRYIADELNEEMKIVIEINGDYVHANPKFYDSECLIIMRNSAPCKASDKWANDKKKLSYIENLGYKVVVIWESDDLEFKKQELALLLTL